MVLARSSGVFRFERERERFCKRETEEREGYLWIWKKARVLG